MNKNKSAFTLIELLIVIAITWIIALWIWKLNFKNISDRQRLDWFFYKVKTNIETIQNNALIWKAVNIWTQSSPKLKVPTKWEIDFSNFWSWKIISYYFTWATNSTKKEFDSIIPANFQSINTICKNRWTDTWNINWTWELIINWWNLTLSWACSDNLKILELTIKYKQFEKKLDINTISWVIEESK